MNIGKYSISRMNDGQWVIEWLDKETRHKHMQFIPDLEPFFDQLVRPRMEMAQEFVHLFRLAFNDSDAFLNLPIAKKLLDLMRDDLFIPVWEYNSAYARFQWHVGQFIGAYAGLTGIELRLDEVLPYLDDMRESF